MALAEIDMARGPGPGRDWERDAEGLDPFLDGWGAIAAALQISTSCAMEWERELGLPVYRLGVGIGARVRLDLADLRAWKEAQKQKPRGK